MTEPVVMGSFDLDSFLLGLLAALGVIGLLWFFCMLCQPYLMAMLSGAHIEFADILAMRLRQTPVHLVIDAYITIWKRALRIPLDKLEATYLAYRFEIHDCAALVERADPQLRLEIERTAQAGGDPAMGA